jgi:hypothetical protein
MQSKSGFPAARFRTHYGIAIITNTFIPICLRVRVSLILQPCTHSSNKSAICIERSANLGRNIRLGTTVSCVDLPDLSLTRLVTVPSQL